MRKKKDVADTIHYVKGSKLPAILVIAVIVMAVSLGMKLGSDWQQRKADKKNHRIEITSDALHQEIEQIGELSTVRYYYTNMGKFEDAVKLLDLDVPFTTKSFILSYDGEIKAGIDLSEVGIDVGDSVITVTIPEAKIMSHEVDMDSVVLYDEKNSIFNGLSAEDVTAFLAKQQSTMEEKAKHNGLLERAQASGEQILKTLLEKFVKANEKEEDSYQLKFVTQVDQETQEEQQIQEEQEMNK